MSGSATSTLDANENCVKPRVEVPQHIAYSLANVKLNRNCPLPDSVLNSVITSLRLEIPSSNDPDYATEVFEKIGKNVEKLVIFKLGDKGDRDKYYERMPRQIPKDFLQYFPQLRELHLQFMHDLDTIDFYPPTLEYLHFKYVCYHTSATFRESIQKIPALKVLKADEIGLTDKQEETETIFREIQDNIWQESKKFCKVSGVSIQTDVNLLEKLPLEMTDVTGIIVDPIDKWSFTSFKGLENFQNLRFIKIWFQYGHNDRCLFPHANISCPSVQELILADEMGEEVCNTCFTNLVKICPNVTSMTLKDDFSINSVQKCLQSNYKLEKFRFKNFRCCKKLDDDRLLKLEALETTLDWDEVENWPKMPVLKKLVVAVRHDTKIVPLGMFLKKCPNLTTFKISSIEAGGSLYAVTQSIAKTLLSLEYLRIKSFNPINYAKLQPLIGCKHLKVLHLITFPDHTNYPLHDRLETLTFDTELELFKTMPSLDLLIVNTEYGKRQFYRGDLFDLKSYFKENIMKYRQPQHIVKYIRENLMPKDVAKDVNSANLSDVNEYLGIEVKARTMESSLVKHFQRYMGNSSDESSESSGSSLSVDSEDNALMDMSSGSSSYQVLDLDGSFSDCREDTSSGSEDLSDD